MYCNNAQFELLLQYIFQVRYFFMDTGYSENQGMRLLRQLLRKGNYIFTHDEVVKAALAEGISVSNVEKLLFKLATRGWILKLRRGLYAAVDSLSGENRVHPFAIATTLVQPSAISHWSAMQYHGLTEQVPHIITASSPKKVVTPSMREKNIKNRMSKHAWEIGGVYYEYITIKKEHFFGIEKIWVDEHFHVPITDKERTLLDVFIFSTRFGGMGEALGIVQSVLSTIDQEKFINYTLQYGKKSIVKRVGWVLEYFGISSENLSKLVEIPVNYYSLLDPGEPARGVYDRRWMIRNNLTE
jgi:predicted transcriptional regulator of viral defense system